ncbi:MAG TPA: flagellar biosynthetic protein FliR [Gammaproteobacteria bacterium]|nr:flagellar biosynthetic protein FliR [Gammaproteobacteria bacterium]
MPFESATLWLFFLAVFRLAPLFLLPKISPFFRTPVLVRLILMAATCLLLVAVQPASASVALPQSGLEAVVALVGESLVGLALALALYMAFAVLNFYGHLLDLQIGFGAAGIFDPTTQSAGALLGSALTLTGVVLFFSFGFQRQMIRGLAASVAAVPLGSPITLQNPMWLAELLGRAFVFGLLVVAPVVIGLFLTDVAVAFSSRMMPQVNVYFLGLPLKIGFGVVLLALSLSYMGPAIARLFQQGFASWGQALGT